jgi:hypothetical protein
MTFKPGDVVKCVKDYPSLGLYADTIYEVDGELFGIYITVGGLPTAWVPDRFVTYEPARIKQYEDLFL